MHALFRFKSLRNIKPQKGVAFPHLKTDAHIALRHKRGCFVIYVPRLTRIKEKHQKEIKVRIEWHISPNGQLRERIEVFDVEEVTALTSKSVGWVAIQYPWTPDGELALNG